MDFVPDLGVGCLIENGADALDKLLVTVRLVKRDELDLTPSLVVAEQRQQFFVPEVLQGLATEDEFQCSPDRAVGFPSSRRAVENHVSRFARSGWRLRLWWLCGLRLWSLEKRVEVLFRQF